jgi:hypothetical protein
LLDECDGYTALNSLNLSPMKVKAVNFKDEQYFMQVTDTLSIQKNNIQLCGPRTYEFTA